MEIIVPGRCVPAPRMTRYSKSAPRTIKYMEYREEIAWVAKVAKIQRIPRGIPVGVRAEIYLFGQKGGDIDNYQKTLLDALNGIAWDDDRQVEEIWAKKIRVKSKKEERVVIQIWGIRNALTS